MLSLDFEPNAVWCHRQSQSQLGVFLVGTFGFICGSVKKRQFDANCGPEWMLRGFHCLASGGIHSCAVMRGNQNKEANNRVA